MKKQTEKLYDAVLIPGGGLTQTGGLPPWVIHRLDCAVELQAAEWFILLSAGTVHKPPPLDEDGFPIFESRAAAVYLIEHGADPGRILIESASYDTIGNAYFSRVMHVGPGQFRRLLVITSAFHAPRTEAVFRWVYSLDVPDGWFIMDFKTVPDTDMPEEVSRERAAREAVSLGKVMKLQRKILTLTQLHEWIFTEHDAYRAGGNPESVKGSVLDSY